MFEEKYQQQPALWELWTEGPRSCGKNRLLVFPQLRQFPQRFAPPQFRYAGSGAIGIGGAVARSPLPHHRTCGSAYGGSDELSCRKQAWESERVEVSVGKRRTQGRAVRQMP